jgi:hypothetical protein
VYQVKRRVEPISSLYVDVGAAAAAAVAKAEDEEAKEIDERIATEAAAKAAKTAAAIAKTAVVAPKPEAEAAQGAIIGKRVLKLKKAPSVAPPG